MVTDVAYALVRAVSRLVSTPRLYTRRILLLLLASAIAVAAPPRRIISTAPSITELLYALGLGDNVVGVTRFCRYPPEAQLKPKIGDYTSPNLEAIAELRPDLVIVQTNPVRLRERLTAVKLHVLEINQDNIAALYTSIQQVGAATGADMQATKLVQSIRAHLAEVQARAAKLPPQKVMFVVGRTPQRLDGLIVVGQASYLNEVIAISGGVNVFRDAPASYPAVSLEDVLARNPEVILDMGEMSDTGVTAQQKASVVALWKRAGSIAAVRNGRVVAVASDIFVVPGPRIVQAADELLQMFHPGYK
jgi:iron complex transport system substrate-binding protein